MASTKRFLDGNGAALPAEKRKRGMMRVDVGLELGEIDRIAVVEVLELRPSLHPWTVSRCNNLTRRRAITLSF